ncbi:MAG: hypothetical protein JSS43_02720 [Proteobacteria bacterium]|nr:hypothetical protein [Pseudomonadota bacterium]
MRCLIGFFGLTRSLPLTAGAIGWAFLDPLRAAGFEVRAAGHFNLPETISNRRSGEDGIVPDRAEAALLGLDVSWVEPQTDDAIATEMQVLRGYTDSYGDGYRSLANLCHQLRSLDRLWSLLSLFEPAANDIVLLLRPDLLYLDRLEPARDLAPLLAGRADLLVPGWQCWGGLNDRFAFCSARAARLYATRFRLLREACREMRGLHAEHFLHFVVACHGLRIGLTGLRAVRIRADGQVARNDQPMLMRRSAAA